MIVLVIIWGFFALVALFGIVAKVFQRRAAARAAAEERAAKEKQERRRREQQRAAEQKRQVAQAEKQRAAAERAREQERKQAEKAAREQERERKRAERIEAARQLAEYTERALQAERELQAIQREDRRETIPAAVEEQPQEQPQEQPAAVTLDQFALDHAAPENPRTFAGERVAFTGKLQGMTRAEAIRLVQERGGRAYKTMPAGTTLLVVGTNPGMQKLDKADEWITQVTKITEAQFMQRIHAAA